MNKTKKEVLSVEPLNDYPHLIGQDLWRLEDTRIRTIDSLEGITNEELDWSRSPDSNNISSILYHIAAIEMSWLYTEILRKEFPKHIDQLFPHDVRDENGRLSIVRNVTFENNISRLNISRKELLVSFQGMTIKDYRASRNFPDYDVTPEWVVHHLIQHEAEHRGQILEIRASAKEVRNNK